jgi:hypothetical protein
MMTGVFLKNWLCLMSAQVLATRIFQQSLGGVPDGLAVVNDHHLDTAEAVFSGSGHGLVSPLWAALMGDGVIC